MRRTDGPRRVLIATDMLMGEGVDIPSLDTLFFASPYMQERVIQQCVGRLSRLYDGKKPIMIHDYVDYRIPRLGYMFSKRITIYRKLGCIPFSDTLAPYEKMLYDESDFLDALLSDISNAESGIVLSTSFLLPSSVTEKVFHAASMKDIPVLLRCRKSACDESLDKANARLISESGLHVINADNPRNYIVIDRRISWYGEMNILGLGRKSMGERTSIMRILDEDVARCLINDDDENFV